MHIHHTNDDHTRTMQRRFLTAAKFYVITGILLCYHLTCISGSVTLLSTDSVNVMAGSAVSLYCHIEPFDHNKCHGWYRENKHNGQIELIVQGSAPFETDKEISPGDIILPAHGSEHTTGQNFTTPCMFYDLSMDDVGHITKYDNYFSTTSYERSSTKNIFSATNYNYTTTSNILTSTELHNKSSSNYNDNHTSNGESNMTHTNTVRTYYGFRHDKYYILTIPEMENPDEGKYFCKYFCKDCDSRRAELVFTYPATTDSMRLISEPNELFVDFHEVVTLTCEVRSRPVARVQWILVLNGVNVPHIEELEPYRIVYDNLTDHFTVISVFKFRGGSVFSNPMVIYCQVLSPISDDLLVDKSRRDLPEGQSSRSRGDNHSHRRRRRRIKEKRAYDHSSHDETEEDKEDVISVTITDKVSEQYRFVYEFETDMEHGHDEEKTPIHYEYLTTQVYKRWIYDLPTSAFSRRWRLAIVILMVTVLVLPIFIGIIQIFFRKTSGLNIGAREQGIEEYYRLAKEVREEQNELVSPGDSSDTKTESDSKA